MQEASPFTVRILPRIAFGAHPEGMDGIQPDHPGVMVLHHYMGTWKVRGWQMLTPAILGSLVSRTWLFLLQRCAACSCRPRRLTAAGSPCKRRTTG